MAGVNLDVSARTNVAATTDNVATPSSSELSSWERAMSCLQTAGGVLQIGSGAFVAANVEAPGIAQAAGYVAMAHGYSDVKAGVQGCFAGKRVDQTPFAQAVSQTAQVAGLEKPIADKLGKGADLAAGFINPAGPATKLPGLALAETTTGERIATVVVKPSAIPQAVSEQSNAAHAVHTAMSASGGDGANKTDEASDTSKGDNNDITPEKRYSGDLVPGGNKDPAANKLAEKLGGSPDVYFKNDPDKRPFDGVSDKYIAQTEFGGEKNPGSSARDQMKATFEAAKATGKQPYFEFTKQDPSDKMVNNIHRYEDRYGVTAVIDKPSDHISK